MTWVSLSHPLATTTPLYGGGAVRIERVRAMEAGDSSNNSTLTLPAHAGTHIDAPRHFDAGGRTLDSFSPDYWHAERPWLIDCLASPGELLDLAKLGRHLATIPDDCDLLLLRTGFERLRDADPETYSSRGPGLAPETCDWLRRHRNLRMLGLDFVSVSSFLHREMGRQAHRMLLAAHESGAEPILPVEDMALAVLETVPTESWIIPVLFTAADGAPVTAIAKV